MSSRKMFPLRLLLFLVCLLAPFSIYAGQANVLLATGFEPFGGKGINESWMAVQSLKGKLINQTEIVVEKLPVVWNKASTKLHESIKKHKPIAVISFGRASSETVLLETTARNIRSRTPDNDGIVPELLLINPTAPPTLETALPVREIEQRLHAQGIPATVSSDAGSYLCNETFYTLMFDPGDEARGIPRGFIHMPSLNAAVTTPEGRTVVFDRDTLRKVAEIIAQAVVDGIEHN